MDAQNFQGQMTGWLKKRKSGKSLVRVSQYHTRYVTLDFESRITYYAHREDSKKVSAVITFADILDVALVEAAAATIDDNTSEVSHGSKSSKASMFKIRGRSSAKEKANQHVLTLFSKAADPLELLCPSLEDANRWYSALKFAMTTASADVGRQAHSRQSQRPPVLPAVGTIEEGFRAPVSDPVAAAAGIDPWLTRQSPRQCLPECDATNQTRKTFLDFSAQPHTEQDEQGAKDNLDPKDHVESVVEIAGGEGLRARAFGHACVSDDSDSESDAEHLASGVARRGSTSSGRSTSADSRDGDVCGSSRSRPLSYKDQHEGLSLKERLASLEFSDDEADEDPVNLAATPVDA